MAQDLAEKFNKIIDAAGQMNLEFMGKLLEELKEYVTNKFGFSRIVFELSKKVRVLAKDPKKILNSQEIGALKLEFDGWLSLLK